MKTTVAVMTLGSLMIAGTTTASAGDKEWATAGKILTGLVAGQVLHQALTAPHGYYEPAVVYSAPIAPIVHPAPVYIAPPRPRVFVHAPVCVAPVFVHARPVYVAPPPVYLARPAISLNLGFGSHRRHHHGHYNRHGHGHGHGKGRGHGGSHGHR